MFSCILNALYSESYYLRTGVYSLILNFLKHNIRNPRGGCLDPLNTATGSDMSRSLPGMAISQASNALYYSTLPRSLLFLLASNGIILLSFLFFNSCQIFLTRFQVPLTQSVFKFSPELCRQRHVVKRAPQNVQDVLSFAALTFNGIKGRQKRLHRVVTKSVLKLGSCIGRSCIRRKKGGKV